MKKLIIGPLLCLIILISCRENDTPKPREYFRIDLPAKNNVVFKSDCPFEFEFPDYAVMQKSTIKSAGPCWYDISIPRFHAKIYLTYKEIKPADLYTHVEDVRALVYKHIVKAEDINESLVIDSKRKVYGILYDLSGNTATSLSFFLTDSTHNFLSGSLYFSASPNKDSLLPVIQFFREDVVHLTETLIWK